MLAKPDKQWIAKWLVAAFDPLVGTTARLEIDDNLRRITAESTQWLGIWSTGFLSDLVRSLDPEDTWRNLRIVEGTVLNQDGTPFGQWPDGTDIAHPQDADIRADLGLAAIAEPLSPSSARLFACAGIGRASAMNCFSELAENADGDGAILWNDIDSSLIWALYRRRQFVGEDFNAPVTGAAWTERADRILAGEPWDESRAARALAEMSIEPGHYRSVI